MSDDSRITEGSGNVFRDLGFDETEAENLRIRTQLMMSLTAYIEAEG